MRVGWWDEVGKKGEKTTKTHHLQFIFIKPPELNNYFLLNIPENPLYFKSEGKEKKRKKARKKKA